MRVNLINVESSIPAGYRFPREQVISLAVHWYLRYGLCCRDIELRFAARGIEVDNVLVCQWMHSSSDDLIDTSRSSSPRAEGRWQVEETAMKDENGARTYLYLALDSFGRVIDMLVRRRASVAAAREFFEVSLDEGSGIGGQSTV